MKKKTREDLHPTLDWTDRWNINISGYTCTLYGTVMIVDNKGVAGCYFMEKPTH